MDRNKLRAELSRDEGRRLAAYRDTNGFWTIGVGHLLGGSPRMSSITERECDALLDADLDDAWQSVRRVFPFVDAWPDTAEADVRSRALVNMIFNRGEERVRHSTSISPAIFKANETGDWSPVASAILCSPWAVQVGPRAERLADMLRTGVAA